MTAIGGYFELENVIVFGLKLRMLEKYHEIRSPKGEEIFKEVDNPEFIEEFLYQTH